MLLYFFINRERGDYMNKFERVIGQMTYDMGRKRQVSKNRRERSYGTPVRSATKVNRPSMMRSASKSTTNTRQSRTQFAVIEGTESLKKFIGILLIAVGILLILTKCAGSFGGGSKKAEVDSKTPATIQVTSAYTEHVQDFEIGGDTLKRLMELSIQYKKDYAHTLAVWAVESYKETPLAEIEQSIKEKDTTNFLDEFGMYDNATDVYKQFIYDIKSFPIREKNVYTYENGWKDSRTYNGNRLHYGIDIMSKANESGQIKIRSMTDGTVENIGWNQTGGYRVGIRSESGAYFYYAHLHSYAKNLKQGDRVQAGEVIGLMGDSGYGEEGTTGQFPVHLHIGIAVKTPDNVEFWINPYSILQYLEQKS